MGRLWRWCAELKPVRRDARAPQEQTQEQDSMFGITTQEQSGRRGRRAGGRNPVQHKDMAVGGHTAHLGNLLQFPALHAEPTPLY